MHRRVTIAILAAAALFPPALAAQGYPRKNVQYIIPFVPGGESDVMARWQQTIFRNKYRQELLVVNKPGAGGGLVGRS
jgi:tripartite-type tricarboxylate transporter receptor subunit TctC